MTEQEREAVLKELIGERSSLIDAMFAGEPYSKPLLRHLERQIDYHEMIICAPMFERSRKELAELRKLTRKITRDLARGGRHLRAL